MRLWWLVQNRRWPVERVGPRWQAGLSALLALSLLLPLWWQAGQWFQTRLLAERRSAAATDLAQYGQALAGALERRFNLLEALGAFVQTHQAGTGDMVWASEFDTFAAGLCAGAEGVRYFAVAPGGVWRYLYPAAGNEALLAEDLLRDDLDFPTRSAIQRAIASGRMTLSYGGEDGPDGGELAAWLAIYQDGRFWGLATMVVDLSPILAEAGLEPAGPAGLALALRSPSGRVLYGRSALFSADPVTYSIELPDGAWELAGAPRAGWAASTWPAMWLFRLAGLAIVGLLVGLVYLAIGQQIGSTQTVGRRAPEISKISPELEKDIIRRKQAEERLEETQRTLSTLLSNLPGMAYRSRNDTGRTMEFVSEGCAELTGYYPDELIQNEKISYMQLIYPEDRQSVWRKVQAAVQEDRPFQLIYRITTAKGQVKWVWEKGRGVFSPGGELLALEGFITDMTERVQAYQTLEQRVTDRTRELSALYEVTAVASRSLNLADTLESSLDQVLTVMGCEVGAIHLFDETHQVLRLAVGRGLSPEVLTQLDWLPPGRSLVGRVIEHGEPLVVPEVAADPRAAEAVIAGGAQAYVGAPMRARGRVLGVLSVVGEAERQFKVEEVALLASIADEIGVAVENAQLYEAERIQRHQADTLLQVASVVGSTLNLNEVLARILDQLHRVVRYDSASVQLLEEGRLQVIAARGFADTQQVLGVTFSPEDAPNHQVVTEGRPINLADAPTSYPIFRRPPFSQIRSWLGVPLRVQERIIGIITVERQQPGGYLEAEVRLTTAFADQAALALENARLYEQIEQLAVMEERSRLARELHDSVTQSLYSLTLFAEVGRRAAEAGELEQVIDYLTRLGQVAQQTLKEMRLLVYELRTSALQTEGLVRVLQQRLEAVEKRAGVESRLIVEAITELPALVEEGLYRIAQEALNNALKHAAATLVTVRINANAEQAELEVIDNGIGFDPAAVSHTGIGLDSMAERAEQLGGKLTIFSQPGEGTRIRVVVPTRRSWSKPLIPVEKR